MKSSEIRSSFLEFFKNYGHKVVPSDSLVPENDPTLLFTGAGMNQFKDQFMGKNITYRRAASCQKCLRTADIENVGKTSYHHTFFEMLGNFSFGDYFKKEAIRWAYEYVTSILKIPPDALIFTVYKEDKEAFEIWNKDIGISSKKIYRMGEETNFWPASAPSKGPNGVCGPCSEIYVDTGKKCSNPSCGPECECKRFVEIWNLVFTQFNRVGYRRLEPLPQKNIDTGMGLERVTAVVNHKESNFETDLFVPIIEEIFQYVENSKKEEVRFIRRIADHIRAVTFCIADGVIPSNEGRGYVVRRLIRRASLDGDALGINSPFLYKLVAPVVSIMGEHYPELIKLRDNIAGIIKVEEEKFASTLQQGIALLQEIIEKAKKSKRELSGKDVFFLYDTFGFPPELTQEMAAEHNISVNMEEFNKELSCQKEKSRKASVIKDDIFAETDADLFMEFSNQTEFVGYECYEYTSRILAIAKDKERVEGAKEGDVVIIVLDKTPFYATAGGQVADIGILKNKNTGVLVEVKDVQKIKGVHLHYCKVKKGEIKIDEEVEAKVNILRRKATQRNHTATHLLHYALRKVLGDHITQAGSYVGPERLRFDFTHFKQLASHQIEEITNLVNSKIIENCSVITSIKKLEEAKAEGAIALFGEKYGDIVRMVQIGDFSKELCGGTHVKYTGEIGVFVITAESSIASGVRRIEAYTGEKALQYLLSTRETFQKITEILKTSEKDIIEKIESLNFQLKKLQKEIEKLKTQNIVKISKEIIEKGKDIRGITLLSYHFNNEDPKLLPHLGRDIINRVSNGVLLLTNVRKGGINVLCMCAQHAILKGIEAIKIIKEISHLIKGGGGGSKDFAQAGGKEVLNKEKIIEKVEEFIKANIKK